jgi:hypothetical protein
MVYAEIGDANKTIEQLNKNTIHLLYNAKDSYDYLIITPEEWKADFELFKQHKNSIGIETIVVSLNEIYNNYYFTSEGRDNQEKIKIFIKNAKENWNIQYVLLIGNKDKLPVRYIPYIGPSNFFMNKMRHNYNCNYLNNQEFISDLYYADIYDNNDSFCGWDSNKNDIFGEADDIHNIDDVDFFPDVYIGRIPCSSSEEIETVLTKIIEYENNAYGQSWLKNLILCGGDTSPWFYEENIWLLILLSKGLIHRRAFEGEYTCNKVAEILNDYNPVKCYSTGFINPKIKSLTVKNINDAINMGGSFFLYVGHGFGTAFATHPPFMSRIWLPYPNMYHISDLDGLTNEGKLHIAVFSACHCSNFNDIPNPIAWKIISHKTGGAIASIASTTVSYSPLATYTTESYMGRLTIGLFKSYSKGTDILGKMWAESIFDYLEDEKVWDDIFPNPISIHYLTLEEWILFGDPTLKIGGYI